MKKVVLLGASGSIGQQCLDILKTYSDEFTLVGVSVGKRIDKLDEIIHHFPSVKHLCTQDYHREITGKYADKHYSFGDNGLLRLVGMQEVDIVINALVGFVGFLPSLRAVECGKDLALANKETLVVGGELVLESLKKSVSKIYPIDSEHSAIWQCLQGNQQKEVSRLIITASGGSFRNKSREQLKEVTLQEALSHPTWSMGDKITIDSATMMNKAFEVMEAHYLFRIPYEKIDVLLHEESVIHSLVEFEDSSVLAQLGEPDMRLPIQFALRYPSHSSRFVFKKLSLEKVGCLHFREMSSQRYPLLDLVRKIAIYGGNIGAALNGANDMAVSLFLADKISFLDIEKAIFYAIKNMNFIKKASVEDIIKTNEYARKCVLEFTKKTHN